MTATRWSVVLSSTGAAVTAVLNAPGVELPAWLRAALSAAVVALVGLGAPAHGASPLAVGRHEKQ